MNQLLQSSNARLDRLLNLNQSMLLALEPIGASLKRSVAPLNANGKVHVLKES
jgi:hypothetical protein